jgi:hypothetical protein
MAALAVSVSRTPFLPLLETRLSPTALGAVCNALSIHSFPDLVSDLAILAPGPHIPHVLTILFGVVFLALWVCH